MEMDLSKKKKSQVMKLELLNHGWLMYKIVFLKHKREICSLFVNYNRIFIATGEENIESQLSSNNSSFVRYGIAKL